MAGMNSFDPVPHVISSDHTLPPVAFWVSVARDMRGSPDRLNLRGTPAPMMSQETQDDAVDRMNDLLAAIAETQDRAAFRAVFDYFAPRVKAFMQRHGTDPGMAEEIVQETMVNVWRKAGQFDPTKASAATWIFTIARNLRIDLLRKANRPVPDANDPAFVPDPEPLGHDVISLKREASQLNRAVAELPPEQLAVLRLAFFEEKPHAEVAAELDIPLGTVKSRIRLAFKRIRSELGEIR